MPVDLTNNPKDTKTNLPIVEAPKGTNSTTIPDAVINSKFEDFEVEQLPAHVEDTSRKTTDDKGAEPKVEDKATEVEVVEGEEPKVEDKVEQAPPKEEVVEDAPVVEENPFDKILKKPGQKNGDTKITPPAKTTRDYTGYNEQQVKALKGMSNEGFELATKYIRENAELAKLKDSTYLQHERAYTLTQEYQDLSSNSRMANFEQQYWNEQLLKMDAGQDLVPLEGYDNKTGRPVLGQPLKPTKALEEQVRQAMYNASNTAQSLKSKLTEYPTKYKNTIQTDLNGIDQWRKSQFSWANDPTVLDSSVDVNGKDTTLKEIREQVASMVPAYLRNSPLLPVIQDLVISTRLQKALLSQYEGKKQVAKVKEEEADLVEPTSKTKGATKAKGPLTHGMTTFEIDPSLV